MIVREAAEKDAVLIALIARATFDETFGHLFRNRKGLLDYFDRTFSVKKIKRSIQKENNVFWVAFIDDLPVGYAKLKLDSPSEFIQGERVAQLQKIYVLKDFLSKKVGLQLQQLLLEKAIAEKRQHIWLSALHSNERAINFYLKNGFKNIGTHTFSIGKENFLFNVMAKKLSD